jgi:hypothetical protein
MKKLLLVVIALAVVAFANSNSYSQAGKISFGVGADVALPVTSGFSDGWGIGIGGTVKVYYQFNDLVKFTGTAGYMTFSGKDVNGFKAGSWSQIPVVVGARYYFTPASASMRFYGAFEMGLIFSSYTSASVTTPAVVVGGVVIYPAQTYGGGSVSGSDFTYQPQVGFEAGKFDVAVRYLGVSGAACIAARIGYIFN